MDQATRDKISRNARAVYKPASIMDQLAPAFPRHASRAKIDLVRERKNGRAMLEAMERLETGKRFARDGDAEIARRAGKRERIHVLDRGKAVNSNGHSVHSINVDVTL